jgi:rhamnosyl/mannosyltransferase
VSRHGETGWLCGTDAESLRAGIEAVLENPGLAARLGRNARHYVMDHYALDRIVELELSLYREILGAPAGV